ncbi:hypothetical protein NC652_034178 [Populus alba x Populus x berolinensis]|nr:hypothetical protein NC652_034178 [Populus alba x Populus x berolinensis]
MKKPSQKSLPHFLNKPALYKVLEQRVETLERELDAAISFLLLLMLRAEKRQGAECSNKRMLNYVHKRSQGELEKHDNLVMFYFIVDTLCSISG